MSFPEADYLECGQGIKTEGASTEKPPIPVLICLPKKPEQLFEEYRELILTYLDPIFKMSERNVFFFFFFDDEELDYDIII